MPDDSSDQFDLTGLAKAPARWAVSRFYEHAEQHTRDLKQASASIDRDWQLERNRGFAAQLQRLEDTEANRAALEALVGDRAFWLVQRNYRFEATREAVDARRHMLLCGAVGSMRLDLTVAQLARVERTLRELDPSDVTLLSNLQSMRPPDRSTPEEQHAAYLDAAHKRHIAWIGHQPSGYMLAGAGCVHVSSIQEFRGAPSLEVTDVGKWVLAVLEDYRSSDA